MSVKSRLLGLKLLEKQKKHPKFAKQLGIEVNVVSKKEVKSECTSIKEEKWWKHSKSTTQ